MSNGHEPWENHQPTQEPTCFEIAAIIVVVIISVLFFRNPNKE